ncbi:hypothetical protein MUK42_28814 [Musa troglodytarum]|uniref:Uncharacterized protein n=1 Tax=Musa troglodytarum TaxID=320322 RepID=A0A9E7FP10_9LILI|nr:hypothetical protein MUK42_28814 [Musa troglodytarum]
MSLWVAYPYLDRRMFSCRLLYSTTPAASTAAAIITPTAIPAFFPPLISPPPTSSPAGSASSPDRISSLLGAGAGGSVADGVGVGAGEETSGGGARGGREFSGDGERDGIESGEGAGGDWRGPPGTGEGELDGATKEKARSAVERRRRRTTEISNAGGEGERAATAAMGKQHSEAADWRSEREAGEEPDFCGLFISRRAPLEYGRRLFWRTAGRWTVFAVRSNGPTG